MKTRKIHNTGAPLLNPAGIVLKNTKISFVIVDSSGKKIDVFDKFTGERISGIATVDTDNNGEFQINLFPNTRGNVKSWYLVHVHNVTYKDFKAILQDGTTPIPWFQFMAGGQYINPYEYSLIQEILDTGFVDDNSESYIKAWSSMKVKTELSKIVNDTTPSSTSTFSSEKISAISHYTHNQMVSSDTWTVVHRMSKKPSVTIVDTGDNEVVGEVLYIDMDTLQIKFSCAFSGKAYLN